jgi:competence protein ComFC
VVAINPQVITGKWQVGYALDVHTLSSTYLGADQYGHDRYDTTRSPLGELLYRLKYNRDQSVVPEIIDTVCAFLGKAFKFELIVPVPASTARTVQPVVLIAAGIGDKIGVPVKQCVNATRPTTQLKDVYDPAQRKAQLDGLYAVDAAVTSGKRILLFDDLFRSGATMNAVTDVLYQSGAADVSALTLTCTRSKS